MFSNSISAVIHRVSANRKTSQHAQQKKVIALGSFDGFHAGHKTLLERVAIKTNEYRNQGQDVGSAILTFYPHPARALNKGLTDWPIQRIKQRLAIVSRYNIDRLFCCHFDSRLGEMSAEEFCQRVLIDQLNIVNLVVGPDAGLGKNRAGDITFLRDFFSSRGRAVDVLPYYTENELKVGSRQIRTFLASGDVAAANHLLGDDTYTLCSRVVHGDKRGRLLDFPTINLRPGRQLVPKQGVYSGLVTFADAEFPAVVNIGIRPTFGGTDLVCEAHVFSTDIDTPKIWIGERYGERVQVKLITYLRDEQKFNGLEELTDQLRRDVALAKNLLQQCAR